MKLKKIGEITVFFLFTFILVFILIDRSYGSQLLSFEVAQYESLEDVSPPLGKEKEQGDKNDLVNNYFMEGMNLYVQRDFENAAALWRKVLALDPNHPKAKTYFELAFNKYQKMEINYFYGLKAMENKKWREAVNYFLNALEMNPRHGKSLLYIDICYKKLQVKVKIVDQPSEKGKVMSQTRLSTDDELILYAIGYNGMDEYLGPLKVDWYSTGTLDKIEDGENKHSIKFVPKTFDTEGTIQGSILVVAKSLEKCIGSFSNVVVGMGRLHHIRIMDAPDFQGTEVTKIEITTDDEKKIYAAGFDKNDIYLGDIPIDWMTTGNIEKTSSLNNSLFSFKSKIPGQGQIQLVVREKFTNYISNIIVRVGKLSRLQIEDQPEGKGKKVNNIEINPGEERTFYSVGYDKYDNLIGPAKADWATTPSLEEVKKKDADVFIFSPVKDNAKGSIVIAKPDIKGDETGIFVLPGKKVIQRIVSEELVLYFAYNGDNLSRLLSVNFGIPYVWPAIKKYVDAVAQYNKIKDQDLIFPKQGIKIPYFKVKENTTKQELAKKLFNDEKMKDLIKIYKKESDEITPDDKVIIVNEEFFRKGNILLEYEKPKAD